MFRIISGTWKGKRIVAPKNFEVRPTTDFAKEALFAILSHKVDFEHITVLDLCAGIGSISLEFASRGTSNITSVDNNGLHVKFISETAKTLGFDSIFSIKQDVVKFLKMQKGGNYDVIFVDLPFESDLYQEVVDLVFAHEMISENGMLIVEHQSRTIPFTSDFITETRKYGNVSFTFLQKNTDLHE